MERRQTDPERGIAQPGTAPRSSTASKIPTSAPEYTPGRLLAHLQHLDQPVSISRLTKQLGLRRVRVRTLLEPLEDRDAVEVNPGLRAVMVRVCDDVDPVTDGGVPADHSDLTSHGLSLDELLELLSTRRRRDTIRALEAHRARDGTPRDYVTVAELTDGILAGRIDLRDGPDPQMDPDVDIEIDAESRKALYVSLKDNHVPRLDEAGLVDYRPQQRGSSLQPLLALTGVADVLKVLEAIASEPNPEPQVDRPW